MRTSSAFFFVFVLVFATIFETSPAAAQRVPDGMYRVEMPDRGFKFFCPRGYQEVPVQPGDEIVVGQYVRAVKRVGGNDPAKRASQGVEIWIASIPKPEPPRLDVQVSPAPEDDEPLPPGPPEDDDGEGLKREDEEGEEGGKKKDDKPKPKSWDEIYEERLSASSFDELIKKRLGGWHVYEVNDDEDRERSWKEYRLGLLPRRGGKNPPPIPEFEDLKTRKAVAWVYELQDRYVALVGFAPAAEFAKRYKDFYRAGRSLEGMEIEAVGLEELAKYYEDHPEYKQPQFRIERRQGLARGWDAIDTENYLILHNSRDKKMLKYLEHTLEAMRAFYEELFPPAAPVEAVSVVRVCRDRQGYYDYGGRRGTAGYWNFVQEELVLYDNVAGRQGSRRGNRDTYIVLYHEAFHQYIHYSTIELPPHTWFNEGYADFFSGALVYSNTGRVKEVQANPWREGTIKKLVETNRHEPLAKLIKMTKAEYYRKGPQNYAQGWSFVYFLEKSRAASRNPAWKKILPTYFVTLKGAWEQERLELSPEASLEDKNKAGQRARDVALEAAFVDVDVDELEEEWKKFVERL